MLTLPRTPAPCSGNPGTANLGWAFLRTFVTLRSVQGGFDRLGRDAITDREPGLEGSHQLKVDKGIVQGNADSYAQLATWANDLGVGTGATWQCPQEWTFS